MTAKLITIRLYNDRGTVKYLSRTSIRRILQRIASSNLRKAYVKVVYGKQKCIQGCVCEFYNDGWYVTKKELEHAVRVFWNES